MIYLYIKQHKKTGLLYFGKTTRKDPERYKGSGLRWRRHLAKHSGGFETLCLWEFDNQEECSEFALQFSKDNNIIKSKNWANLIEENGLGGVPKGTIGPNRGKILSLEQRKLISKNHADVNGEKNPNFGKPRNQETKNKISESKKGQSSGEKNPMYGSKFIWITNGKDNKRYLGDKIPEGFRKGTIKHKQVTVTSKMKNHLQKLREKTQTTVIIDDIEYESLSSAGRAFNICAKSVSHRLKSKHFPNWKNKNK